MRCGLSGAAPLRGSCSQPAEGTAQGQGLGTGESELRQADGASLCSGLHLWLLCKNLQLSFGEVRLAMKLAQPLVKPLCIVSGRGLPCLKRVFGVHTQCYINGKHKNKQFHTEQTGMFSNKLHRGWAIKTRMKHRNVEGKGMKPSGGHFGGKLMFWATRKPSVKKMDTHATATPGAQGQSTLKWTAWRLMTETVGGPTLVMR